ncbi:MAG: DUF6599 family protein [bacterium]
MRVWIHRCCLIVGLSLLVGSGLGTSGCCPPCRQSSPAIAGTQAVTTPPTAEVKLPPVGPRLTFTANELYGHINGGAELFLEFGFSELGVQNYQTDHGELELETYRMKFPLAALGIYLAKCGHETPLPGLSARNSGNRFQLVLVRGPNYYQINNFSGDEALVPHMVTLARQVVAGVSESPESAIWEYLETTDRIPGTQRLIRGPFALEPIYTLGEGDILQLGGEIFGVVANYRDTANRIFTSLVVPYPDVPKAAAAFASLRANLDSYLQVINERQDGFVFQDYRDRYGQARLTDSVLRVTVNLVEPPGD